MVFSKSLNPVWALALWTLAVLPCWADLPGGVTLKPYLKPAASTFEKPISFHEIPGKPGSFLVVEKAGKIHYYEPGSGKSWEWMKIAVHTRAEEGLYAVAFHPDFINNSRYFIYYNPASNVNAPPTNYGFPGEYVQILAEYQADAKREKDSGKPPKIIREFCCKEGPGHNGMYPVFGHDGMLYLSFGDGNSDGRETQTRKTILGTILRIDVDNPDPGKNYGIPKDNPFYNDSDPKVIKEIWSYGLRNNFKLAVDPLNGHLWVGNVGGWHEDHISLVKKGDNFGWPITEGSTCFNTARYSIFKEPLPNCDRTGITPPTIILPHPHPRGRTNSTCVIGPVVYRSNSKSQFYGALFYADYTGKQLLAASLDENGKMREIKKYDPPKSPIVHLMQSSDGRILTMGHGGNQFHYLDHPDLILAPTVNVKRSQSPAKVVHREGKAYYDVAGKRLIPMPFATPRFTLQN